jgi:hypothetical protein
MADDDEEKLNKHREFLLNWQDENHKNARAYINDFSPSDTPGC